MHNVDDNIVVELDDTHEYIEYSSHVVEQDSSNQFIILENVTELPFSVEANENIFENTLELYNILQENEGEGLDVTPTVDTEEEIVMQVSLIDDVDDTGNNGFVVELANPHVTSLNSLPQDIHSQLVEKSPNNSNSVPEHTIVDREELLPDQNRVTDHVQNTALCGRPKKVEKGRYQTNPGLVDKKSARQIRITSV